MQEVSGSIPLGSTIFALNGSAKWERLVTAKMVEPSLPRGFAARRGASFSKFALLSKKS